MVAETITINRGDTYKYNINILDDNGDAIDCTGWSIWFTVRKSVAKTSVKTDIDAAISKKFTGNSLGVIPMELSKTDTDIDPGNYVYDAQVENNSGVHSSSTGTFTVLPDVTRDR